MLAAIGIPGIATSFRMFEIEIERIYRGSLGSECKIDRDPAMSSTLVVNIRSSGVRSLWKRLVGEAGGLVNGRGRRVASFVPSLRGS